MAGHHQYVCYWHDHVGSLSYTILAIVIGNMLATGALLLSSLAGSYYHSASSWLSTISPTTNRRSWLTKYIAVNFPVFSRAVWGMWGSQFSIWNRIFLSFGIYIQLLDFVFGVTLLTLNISLVSRLHLPSYHM